MAASSAGLGVRQLDLLLGDVPHGAALCLLNDPGVEAEPFLHQAAAAHLAAGERVLYAVTSRSPGAVAAGLRELGAPPEGLEFLDGFSPLYGQAPAGRYGLEGGADVRAFAAALERAGSEMPGSVLVLDSLSALLDQSSPEAFAAALPRLLAAMRRFRLSVSLFTRWPYGEAVERHLLAFDGLVTLRGVEDRVRYSQYFAVERASWSQDLDRKPRLYKVARPGGVLVYVPKVLVTGPFNAGKSSFIHAASDTAVSADVHGTTVAMDHGHVTIDGLTADLFGTPGQARFDPILGTLAAQAVGVIVVVDSTQPDTFPRAREMMELTWKRGLPALIAASKQDLPGALAPEDVAIMLGAPANVRVVGCRGNDPASARRVLAQLIDQILQRSVEP